MFDTFSPNLIQHVPLAKIQFLQLIMIGWNYEYLFRIQNDSNR